MKKILLLITLSFFTICAIASESITVLSYNIHHGEGTDGVYDLQRIARVIRSVTPDLVHLQEVDRLTQRSGKVDQPRVLGRMTGMSFVYGKAMDYQGGAYGNAILTRLSIAEKDFIHLPHSEGREPRVVTIIKTFSPQKRIPFYFMGTHLDHLRDATDRLMAVPVIEEWVQEKDIERFLLVGDLNDTPQSPPMQKFFQSWFGVGRDKTYPTFPSSDPQRQIDYILFRPPHGWSIKKVQVLDEPIASDHCPIMAVLEIN